jgi:3-oxoacyl-[acyl-carrier-protein] synthase II
VFGEGAGVFVLEDPRHARRRGAEPLAVLRGYGLTAEQHGMVAPDPTGAGIRRAGRQAQEKASAGPAWVKAHGTGTRLGDEAELIGLRALLGSDLSNTPVTGLKPVVGHCLGASAAVEAVLTVLALREGVVPRTIGSRALDPTLPRCDLVTELRPAASGDVLLLAEGFGGRCAALRIGLPD